MRRNERRAYLMVSGVFILLIAGLTWQDSGKYLFDETRYFWELPQGYLRPSLSLEMSPADDRGIEVTLLTTNYSFSELCNVENPDRQVVEGHAHLYVNGRKRESLFVPFAIVDDLPPGEHVISVSLHVLPNHQALTIQGEPVSAERLVQITDDGIEIIDPSLSVTAGLGAESNPPANR